MSNITTVPIATAATLQATIAFDAQVTLGSDFGSGVSVVIAMTTDGGSTYSYSPGQQISTNRLRYSIQHSFALPAGATAVVGMVVQMSGARAMTAWNVDTKVEVIKR